MVKLEWQIRHDEDTNPKRIIGFLKPKDQKEESERVINFYEIVLTESNLGGTHSIEGILYSTQRGSKLEIARLCVQQILVNFVAFKEVEKKLLDTANKDFKLLMGEYAEVHELMDNKKKK